MSGNNPGFKNTFVTNNNNTEPGFICLDFKCLNTKVDIKNLLSNFDLDLKVNLQKCICTEYQY